MTILELFKKKIEQGTEVADSCDLVQQNEIAKEYAKEACRKIKMDTNIPFMKMSLVDSNPSIYESKVGGVPYLPNNMEAPKSKNGTTMLLLAQINCTDLVGLPDYPHSGILQFWLTPAGMLDEAKVVYYNEVEATLSNLETLSKESSFSLSDKISFPVMGSYGVNFEISYEPMSNDDCRLEALFCQYYAELSGEHIGDPEEPGLDVYYEFNDYRESTDSSGHKIGGYEISAQPPQYDERNEDDPLIDIYSDDSDVLLFQLDSEYGKFDFETRTYDYIRVSWCDSGVGRFHIKRKDLKNLDFSKVWFTWDCS